MTNISNVLFAFVILASGTFSLEQRITIWELPDQKGDSHSLTGKYSDLSNSTFDLKSTFSYCQTGWFAWYRDENFQGKQNYDLGATLSRCVNYDGDLTAFKSARIIGPPDMSTPALALYEGGDYLFAGGQEIVVTGTAMNNFGFAPKYIVAFGNSAWTLFTENNFGGSSTCHKGPFTELGVHGMVPNPNNGTTIQSVIKSCDPAVIKHYQDLHA